jgi:hypothetical protein
MYIWFEVFMAVKIKIVDLWVMTPCNLQGIRNSSYKKKKQMGKEQEPRQATGNYRFWKGHLRTE